MPSKVQLWQYSEDQAIANYNRTITNLTEKRDVLAKEVANLEEKLDAERREFTSIQEKKQNLTHEIQEIEAKLAVKRTTIAQEERTHEVTKSIAEKTKTGLINEINRLNSEISLLEPMAKSKKSSLERLTTEEMVLREAVDRLLTQSDELKLQIRQETQELEDVKKQRYTLEDALIQERADLEKERLRLEELQVGLQTKEDTLNIYKDRLEDYAKSLDLPDLKFPL